MDVPHVLGHNLKTKAQTKKLNTCDCTLMTTEGALGEAVVSYQNQTAQDIESGRSRINSVGSYASNHSDDALLPEVHVIKKANGVTSAAPENVRL